MARQVAALALLLAPILRSAASGGLPALPSDIAEQAKSAAFNYAWAATNERMGPRGDVAQNQLAAEAAIAQMKKLGKGLLTDDIVFHFQWLAFNSGWYAANLRSAGGLPQGDPRSALEQQAAQNMHNIEEHRQALLDEALLDTDLVWNLNWMCWRASWYAANTRAGFSDDAKTDEAYFNHHADLISGEVTLLSIDFDDHPASTAAARPLVVGDQTLDNSKAGHEESMTFSYSYAQGSTSSWSHSVGFKLSIQAKISAGFLVEQTEFSFGFEASYTGTWSGGKSDGTTKSYSFPLVVPSHKIYQAKATVHQANMEVPYKMTLAIGDRQWTASGIWSGVAVSTSTYTVSDITPGSSALGEILGGGMVPEIGTAVGNSSREDDGILPEGAAVANSTSREGSVAPGPLFGVGNRSRDDHSITPVAIAVVNNSSHGDDDSVTGSLAAAGSIFMI